MTQGDIPAVLAIQAAAYGQAYLEPEAVLRARLAGAPGTAWLADDGAGPCAYLVGYRSRLGRVTPLGGVFADLAGADCLYLHDLAVAPRAGGAGVAGSLVEHAHAHALAVGLGRSALVSVQGSLGFWQRRGYRVVLSSTEPAAPANLLSYPGPAYYMQRDLP
ncbi:GNAT family N-acetyltransferase [Parasulfuritortus cantonensis]|uniref:GNAT family N-acetyltransferase n=2 Tax=Parasulfuritortus cantonensis TaxID=2528202 RepID=A0A4R1B6G9_9PROT|nr:GNAT family N-acetyltransferase [Parasulfuritortus cantonensis]